MKNNSLIYVLAAIVILGGLFFAFKPKQQPAKAPESTMAAEETSPSATAQSNTNIKEFDLVIKNKKLVSGPDTLQVTQGDQVIIKITSDIQEELHLHGYDKSVDIEKDIPAELKFTADKTGRFEYELEKSKIDIGALEVQPKQ